MGLFEGSVIPSAELSLALADGFSVSDFVIASVGFVTVATTVGVTWIAHRVRKADRARLAHEKVLQLLNQGEKIGDRLCGDVLLTCAEVERLNIVDFRISARQLAGQNVGGAGAQLREIAELAQRLEDLAVPGPSVIVTASAGDPSTEDQRLKIARQKRIATNLLQKIDTARQVLLSQP
ncbi:hypothetical protein VA596_02385 [Amycolatopsis sp., V23-08]|uniref:Transmembrane protein n=1 Tax=Amycolatopsis heterodermiae TaxID=3110235 RepID=A0ABU5QY61_9PSEU|nr:hypothetical protein [Amycolatopsis sp., V23-08]MEA5358369.1 hypothetical protein [Amycolatopsis sp., V23-08]